MTLNEMIIKNEMLIFLQLIRSHNIQSLNLLFVIIKKIRSFALFGNIFYSTYYIVNNIYTFGSVIQTYFGEFNGDKD
jgi:hypothetical protein